MNTPLITMEPAAARAKLKAFRADRHRDAEELYRATEKAYAALAEGTPLLSLSQAIQAGGYFPDMRPKIAVARADRREVFFRWSSISRIGFFRAAPRNQTLPDDSTLRRAVDMGRTHGAVHESRVAGTTIPRDVEGFALVPMVPADVRPKVGQLREWFVLWEVTQWFDRPQLMKAPIDPLLLKHVGGDLYAVIAEWDLTDVERFILQETARR